MKASELREMTSAELDSKLQSLKEELFNLRFQLELFNLRFQLTVNQLENPMRIKAVKKDIARVQTVIRQNELSQQADA